MARSLEQETVRTYADERFHQWSSELVPPDRFSNFSRTWSFKFLSSHGQSKSIPAAFPVEHGYRFPVKRIGALLGFADGYDTELAELR